MGADKQEMIGRCIRLVLRPVLRLGLHYSIKLRDIVELCKIVLIEVAAEHIEQSGKQVTISRISVMTGVHKAEVGRIYKNKEVAPRKENVVDKVINRWQQDARFQTKGGRPRVLRLDGMDSDFVELVTSVSTALNPYTVLFEMERVNAVERTRNGIKLAMQVYVPKDAEEGFRFLSEDMQDMVSGVAENVLDNPDLRNLHIKTVYDNIPTKLLPAIRQRIMDEGAAFHKKIATYLSRFDRDVNPKSPDTGKRARVALGSFSFSEEMKD